MVPENSEESEFSEESEVFDKADSKLGHSYGTPTYVWNGDEWSCQSLRTGPTLGDF